MQIATTSLLIVILLLLAIRSEFIIIALVTFPFAICLGLYGIWRSKGLIFVSSCVVVSIGIIILNLDFQMETLLVAIFFVAYIELGHGAARFYKLEKIAREEEKGGTTIMNLKDTAKRYIYLCLLIILFASILTCLLLNLTTILGFFSEKIAESIELNSVYGVVIWMTMVFGFFWLTMAMMAKS